MKCARFLVLVLIAFSLLPLRAPGQTDSSSTRAGIHFDDRSGLHPFRLDKDKIENYKKDKGFDYSQAEKDQNWWQAFKRWANYVWQSFWETIFGNLHPGSWLSTVIAILKYLIIVGIIVFFIWLFIRLNPGRALVKTKEGPEVFLSEEDRIIQEKNIPQLIEEALRQQNYRLAVRYYYLWVLKNLKEKRIIEYQYDKTNQEYHEEMKDPALAERFDKITRLYDFIWYGNFTVNKQQYHWAENEFKAMQTQINRLPNA